MSVKKKLCRVCVLAAAMSILPVALAQKDLSQISQLEATGKITAVEARRQADPLLGQVLLIILAEAALVSAAVAIKRHNDTKEAMLDAFVKAL